jgi:hypothetical protein
MLSMLQTANDVALRHRNALQHWREAWILLSPWFRIGEFLGTRHLGSGKRMAVEMQSFDREAIHVAGL